MSESRVCIYLSPDEQARAKRHAEELGLSLSAYFRLLDSCFILANRGRGIKALRENIEKGRNDVLLADMQTYFELHETVLYLRRDIVNFHEEVTTLHAKINDGGYFNDIDMVRRLGEIAGELEKVAGVFEEVRDFLAKLDAKLAANTKAALTIKRPGQRR